LLREIERRVREVKNGSVKLVDWKDTRARILKRLSAKKSQGLPFVPTLKRI